MSFEMQIPITWSHVWGFWIISWKIRVCSSRQCVAPWLPHPDYHLSGKYGNTYHLESTTVGKVSELRAPWGRRFHGPGKRHTYPRGSMWLSWGVPRLLHSALLPVPKSKHPFPHKALVRDQAYFSLEAHTQRLCIQSIVPRNNSHIKFLGGFQLFH